MNIGERIKEIRKKQGLTQAELADLANVSRVAIGNYERGDRTPKFDIMMDIAEALNVEISDLVDESVFDEMMRRWSKEIRREMEIDRKKMEENDSSRRLKEDTFNKYEILNFCGQLKANDYINDLVEIPKYTNIDDSNE